MVAQLWAIQIANGNVVFSDVPRLLRDKVREILIESGNSERVTS